MKIKKKKCTRCKKRKSILLFSKRNASKDGLHNWCKECASEYNKKDKLLNPEKHRARSYKWRNENPERSKLINQKCVMRLKKKVIDAYGGKCSCKGCGEDNFYFLTVDHVNNDGAAYRKKLGHKHMGIALYRWLIDNNFPKEFQILCWNCNCGKRFLTDCPHYLPKPEFNI